MELSVIFVLVGVLGVMGVALVAGLVAARSGAHQADARLAAALEQQAAALAATLGHEREHTVTAAADMAARMAGEKLGDSMQSGSVQLDLRASTFEKRVEGLTAQLERLGDVVGRLQQEGAQQHGQLVAGLQAATASTTRLAETTGHLREALASPKARGQWGERMADDVLRLAGMVEGVTYKKQTAIAGGAIPDVTFLLPGERVLHMDVKFPIDNYLRHLEAGTDGERTAAAKAFLRDVRNRVKELSTRGYIDPDITLDEVLLFIPNESVWAFIHEQDPDLIDVALRQKVVLCSPFTLFAVLAVIRQSVEYVALERTSDEILTVLSGFSQQWEKFSDAVDGLGKKLETTSKAYEELAGPRRRQLQRSLDKVDDLRSRAGLDGDGELAPALRAVGD